jgi:hypothetical protein
MNKVASQVCGCPTSVMYTWVGVQASSNSSHAIASLSHEYAQSPEAQEVQDTTAGRFSRRGRYLKSSSKVAGS